MNVKANLVWVLAAAMVCSVAMPVRGDDPPNPQVESVIEAIHNGTMGRAREVAAAAGGFLGVGTISNQEREVLAELERAFS